jgi:hypothetical protein
MGDPEIREMAQMKDQETSRMGRGIGYLCLRPEGVPKGGRSGRFLEDLREPKWEKKGEIGKLPERPRLRDLKGALIKRWAQIRMALKSI